MRLHAASQDFYRLCGQQEAQAFDERDAYFAGCIAGGNAWLVKDADIEVMEEAWLGSENKECGYQIDFAENDSAELRRAVLQGLIQRGYAVCPWWDHLLCIPNLDRVTAMVAQDLHEVMLHSPVKGETSSEKAALTALSAAPEQVILLQQAINALSGLLMDLADVDDHINPVTGDYYGAVRQGVASLDEAIQAGIVPDNYGRDAVAELIADVKKRPMQQSSETEDEAEGQS